MVSNSSNGTAQAQRFILGPILVILLAVLIGCTAGEPNPGPGPSSGQGQGQGSGQGPGQGSGSDPLEQYRKFDQEVSQLLQRQAVWRAPKRIKIGDTAQVGLVIGDPNLLRSEINQLVPGSQSVPAGTVKVGATIDVDLYADSSDASITPDAGIDKSMGEHTALLWTWDVHPTHPNSGLLLSALIETQMSNGYVQNEEVAITIPVDRTLQYTAHQIFVTWGTWAAIVGASAALVTWIRKKRKKQPQEAAPASEKNADQPGGNAAKLGSSIDTKLGVKSADGVAASEATASTSTDRQDPDPRLNSQDDPRSFLPLVHTERITSAQSELRRTTDCEPRVAVDQ